MVRSTARLSVLLALMVYLPAFGQEAGSTAIPFPGGAVPPITITVPGGYLLEVPNITAPVTGAPLIIIGAPPAGAPFQHVVIDLNGYALDNTANPGFPVIVYPGGAPAEIVIKNGTIIGGSDGIAVTGGATKVVIENVRIAGGTANGIHLTSPANLIIRHNVISGAAGGGAGILIDAPVAAVARHGTIEENLISGTINGIVVTGGGAVLRSSLIIQKNQLNQITSGPFPAAISLFNAEPCLVSENTIEGVSGAVGGASGIFGSDVEGCKFVNNVMSDVSGNGIWLTGPAGIPSQDNLLIHNIVRGAGLDGILIGGGGGGARNDIEGNLLHINGVGGVGFGLHFLLGAVGNRIGRNSATGNAGGPAPCAVAGNADYCDENGPIGAVTFSFGDNMMPGPATF